MSNKMIQQFLRRFNIGERYMCKKKKKKIHFGTTGIQYACIVEPKWFSIFIYISHNKLGTVNIFFFLLICDIGKRIGHHLGFDPGSKFVIVVFACIECRNISQMATNVIITVLWIDECVLCVCAIFVRMEKFGNARLSVYTRVAGEIAGSLHQVTQIIVDSMHKLLLFFGNNLIQNTIIFIIMIYFIFNFCQVFLHSM